MKKYILITMAGFAAIVAISIWSRNGQTIRHGVDTHRSAENRENPLPSARTANRPNDYSAASKPMMAFEMYVDLPEVSKSMRLSIDQIAAIKALLSETRSSMTTLLARHGKFERLDEKSARWTVTLPKAVAESERETFYRKLGSIINANRLTEFSSLVNTAKFEAAFEFFGIFPLIYEFDSSEKSLANTQIVDTRTTVLRHDERGSYNSFWEEKSPTDEFMLKYGLLADRAIREN